jgi:hypothetical protein
LVGTPVGGTDCHHLEQSDARHLPRLYLAILGGEDDPLICRFFAPANQCAVAIKIACRRCEMCCQESTQHQCCRGAQCVILHQQARPSTRQWRSPRYLFYEPLNLEMILMRRRPRGSLHRLRGCSKLLAPQCGTKYVSCVAASEISEDQRFRQQGARHFLFMSVDGKPATVADGRGFTCIVLGNDKIPSSGVGDQGLRP